MRIHLLAAAVFDSKPPTPVPVLPGMVAVGGNTIRLFSDGNVESHIPNASYVWNDVVVANGMIVAVSNLSKVIAYKPLVGGTWTVTTIPIALTTAWRAVTFLNGRFYFFGYASANNAKLVSTADFSSWDYITTADSTNEIYFKMSTWNGKLLVPTRDINRVKSVDPVTKVFTEHDINFGAQSYYPYAFKVVNGYPFGLGQGRKVSVGSIVNDVIQFELPLKASGGTISAHARDVEYSPKLGLYVVVGTSGSADHGSAPIMYTSPDRETWTLDANANAKFGASNGLQSIAVVGDDIFIGCNDGQILKTSDLINFTTFSSLPAHVFNMKTF